MKKSFALVLFLLLCNLSNAQLNPVNLQAELEKIYNDYQKQKSFLSKKYLEKYKILDYDQSEISKLKSDSLFAIDYENYYEELIPYNKIKREELKKLLEKLNSKNPLIGNRVVYSTTNLDEVEKINSAKNNPDYANFEFIEISKKEDEDLFFDSQIVEKIRKNFINNFDASFFEEIDAEVLSAKITFILDSDGYLKKIIPAEGDEEFAYVCAISLYQMHKRYEPGNYKGKAIVTRYALPISMRFE